MKLIKSKIITPWIFKIIKALLLLGIILNVGLILFQQKNKYISTNYWERYPNLKQTYLDSQYANKNPKGFVPDEVVYAYAGGAFIKGAHPLHIIPDAPPLGKYIIGISIFFFKNEHIIMPIFAVISLLLIYILSKQIFSNTILSLLPVFLYSSETLFKNQLVYTPLFDLIQLVFFLGILILFNKGLRAKSSHLIYIISVCILIGLFISTKFFVSGITIIAACFLALLYRKDKKRFISLTLALPLVPLILLTTYFRVFAYGYSIRELIGAQKWIFIYHTGQLVNPFSIWPLLMMNQWYVWWGDKPILSDSQWTIIWPIITILSLVTIILYLLRKINKRMEIEILMAFTICYLLFFSIGQITTRYFIILLPVLYIITLYGVVESVKKYAITKS